MKEEDVETLLSVLSELAYQRDQGTPVNEV